MEIRYGTSPQDVKCYSTQELRDEYLIDDLFESYLAKRFEENSNRLMESYADFFDRDGFTNMWGRSNIYGLWNYAKLSYNTKYPWESTPETGCLNAGFLWVSG